MADINKSALLIFNEDKTKFLVTRKSPESVTTQWIMPGGSIEEGETIEGSLVREIQEELSCGIDVFSLEFVGEYEAPAAGQTHKIVNIQLYTGTIIGVPVASSEIVDLAWLGCEDVHNQEASEIIRNHIIPELIQRKILK